MSEEKKEELNSDFGGFSLFKNDTTIINDSSIIEETPNNEEVVEEVEKIVDEVEVEETKKVESKETKKPTKKETKAEVDEEVEEETEPGELVDETEELEEVEETEEVEEEGSFKPFIEHLANKGILDYNSEDEFEDTEEGLEKIVANTVKNGINDYKKSIPEDGQRFLEFLENGGRPSDFHKYYYSEATFEDFSLENEDDQKYIYSEGLRLEGYSEEDIADEIQDALDLGKLEKKAELHLKKLQKLEAKNKETLLENQRKAKEEAEKRYQEEVDNFKKGLYESETIAGFKLSKKERDEVWDYMTSPVDKKTGETQYSKDMPSKGAQARYLLAWMMKNNFDITKLEKKVQSKEVGKLRKKLGNFSDSRSKIKSGTATREEPTGNNPFAGFSKALD